MNRETTAAERINARYEEKYRELSGVMRKIQHWQFLLSEFRGLINPDAENPVTVEQVDAAEAEMLADIRALSALDAQGGEHCQCPACINGLIHASDCAVHNMPAEPNGPCDCGVQEPSAYTDGTELENMQATGRGYIYKSPSNWPDRPPMFPLYKLPLAQGGKAVPFAFMLAKDGKVVMGEQCCAEDAGCLSESAEYEEAEVVPVYTPPPPPPQSRRCGRRGKSCMRNFLLMKAWAIPVRMAVNVIMNANINAFVKMAVYH